MSEQALDVVVDGDNLLRLGADGKPDTSNDLVVRGADGDPTLDPLATRMIEKESIERVIEGLKMAADACSHMIGHMPSSRGYWMKLRLLLDNCRKIASSYAGITDTVNETPDLNGRPELYTKCMLKFRDGLRQASGGMRQLATCFRADFVWSRMAGELETMLEKVNKSMRGHQAKGLRRGLVWMPGDE